MDKIHEECSFGHPPETLKHFVEKLATECCESPPHERREHARTKLIVPVQIQPLDESYGASGDTITALTRDISQSGIGIISPRSISDELVAVRLSLHDNQIGLNMAARVLRCEKLGGFYDIGCQFVTRLEVNDP